MRRSRRSPRTCAGSCITSRSARGPTRSDTARRSSCAGTGRSSRRRGPSAPPCRPVAPATSPQPAPLPDTLGYRAGNFVRRIRALVAAAALVVLALSAGLAGPLTQTRRATRAAALAAAQRRRADEQRDFALRQLGRAEAINDLNAFLLPDAAPSRK